ncbi:helix-turn-helix transcriptional regulator [Massilia varians]|uniref:helix-turn-helix transcriptional regulator n=1 Tax=Massilia varians TaxID=457921 RepID=UPI002554616E|nr:helix-turn-helix domain-containing protein [Massilia varians]MDK6077298.1 helix-turn-helix domain-containing protein [Massilia varians]
MSKRKPMDKAQARERRNRLLEVARSAELSLTEGVREMRAIAGMTQEEFARHREVSARVIKAIELGQGNPTVATLNRIGDFFGLQVGFVPKDRGSNAQLSGSLDDVQRAASLDATKKIILDAFIRGFTEAFGKAPDDMTEAPLQTEPLTAKNRRDAEVPDMPARKKRKRARPDDA